MRFVRLPRAVSSRNVGKDDLMAWAPPHAQPNPAERTPQVARASRPLRWHKAGTIERILRSTADDQGRRLHVLSKAIAALLLTYADQYDDDPRCFKRLEGSGDEPGILDQLGLDRKTFTKHVDSLLQRGYVEIRRDRAHGQSTFYLRGLIEAFRETEPAATVRTVTPLPSRGQYQTGKLSHSDEHSEDSQAGRVSQSIGQQIRKLSHSDKPQSGKQPHPDRETGPADRETFPLSLELQGTLITQETPLANALTRAAATLGLGEIKNLEAIQHEVLAVANAFASWRFSARRQRRTIAHHGWVRVAGAVGYALDQERIAPGTIRAPGALFEYALKQGIVTELVLPPPSQRSQLGGSSNPPQPEETAPESAEPCAGDREVRDGDPLCSALHDYLRTRLSKPDYSLLTAGIQSIVREASSWTVLTTNSWMLGRIQQRMQPEIVQAIRHLAGADVNVTIAVANA